MTRRLAAALAMAAMCSIPAGPRAQTPAFSSRVESVRVDVLVTDNGKPVLGLKPSDFEIKDNGVTQTVDLASYEELPLNVVLALDMSSSVDPERMRNLRAASSHLLDHLKATDQAALVTFSHVVSEDAPLTSHFATVRDALARTQAGGQTSLIDAAFTGMMVGESDAGRSLLIVFTDGVDTTSWLRAQDVVETAKRSDVVVYGVSVGKRKADFLEDLSNGSGGRLIQIESTRDLDATFNRILEEFRQRYLISYSPAGVPAEGWHKLDVSVRGRKVTVRARPGYTK